MTRLGWQLERDEKEAKLPHTYFASGKCHPYMIGIWIKHGWDARSDLVNKKEPA